MDQTASKPAQTVAPTSTPTSPAASPPAAALPDSLYGTRSAIFHLLRQTSAPALTEDTPAAAPSDPAPKTQALPVVTPAAPAAPIAQSTPRVIPKAPQAQATQAQAPSPSPLAPSTPTADNRNRVTLSLKTHWRQKQRVAEGTSARFSATAKTASNAAPWTQSRAKGTPLVLASPKLAQETRVPGQKKPLTPAAMAVLRRNLQSVSNTDEEPSRTLLPLPVPKPIAPPVVSKPVLNGFFAEDQFDFRPSSRAAALREGMVARRMQAAS